jgi:transposase
MSRPKVAGRFAAVKTVEQQARQMLIGVRESLLKRRTQASKTIRGSGAEFGLVAAKGLAQLERLIEHIEQDRTLPELVRQMFAMLVGQYRHASAQIREIEARLTEIHRANPLSRRRAKAPTIGPVTAEDHSTGGKARQGGITRAGDETLRSLFICGATSVIQQVRRGKAGAPPWLVSLVKRKPPKLAAVALANKAARIAWRMMVTGEPYDPRWHDAHDPAGADPLGEAA